MAIKNLIPWVNDGTKVPVRRKEEDQLLDLRGQMNRLFDEFFERPFGMAPFFDDREMWGDFAPSMDVSETDKEVLISAELPGMEPEDIEVSLDHNMLTINGEKHSEKEEKDKRYHRIERSYGSFRRVIQLPSEVDANKVDANFKRGVLEIKMPKTEAAQKNSKRITVKKG